MTDSMTNGGGGVVVVAGATSTAGHAVVRALSGTGATVLALSRSDANLATLQSEVPAVRVRAVDVTDAAAVADLHDELRAEGASVESVVHLVGGWRGSDDGIVGQSDDDWTFLEASLRGLRVLSREFVGELAAAPQGRLVAVSSTVVRRPKANTATYAAVKAATEAWTLAAADGFTGTDAAAAVIVAMSLADRETALGELVIDILRSPARVVNGQLIRLH